MKNAIQISSFLMPQNRYLNVLLFNTICHDRLVLHHSHYYHLFRQFDMLLQDPLR